MASTCVSSCKGLTAAKGFITDGEEEPFRGWKTELPKATHLRCIHHFQSNCEEKLRETGIREAKSQKIFLDKVFGIPERMDGNVDSENETEVKEQLQNAKEVLDEKEKELLKKESSYRPLFSKFLDERQRMIAKTMSLKASKPARPYTNGSEVINDVLLHTKESYL